MPPKEIFYCIIDWPDNVTKILFIVSFSHMPSLCRHNLQQWNINIVLHVQLLECCNFIIFYCRIAYSENITELVFQIDLCLYTLLCQHNLQLFRRNNVLVFSSNLNMYATKRNLLSDHRLARQCNNKSFYCVF
jgi:hypothetical protein